MPVKRNITFQMKIKANAKINIGLWVEDSRADGYHNLQTVFYPIPVYDDLDIVARPDKKICLTATCNGKELPFAPQDNIVYKICRYFQNHYDISGVDIKLAKHIPMGAGLGGGSSDGSFTAILLNRLFGLNLSQSTLEQLLAGFGADCAFFVRNSACYATGIGDKLENISLDLSGYELLLVKPPVEVSTAAAYSRVQSCKRPERLKDYVMRPVEQWQNTVLNDFEESVFKQFDEIKRAKDMITSLGADYAAMSGSGATVYGLFSSRLLADEQSLRKIFSGMYVKKVLL